MRCIVRKNFTTVCRSNANPKKQAHCIVQVKGNQKNLQKECYVHIEKYKVVEEEKTETCARNRYEIRSYKKYEFTTEWSPYITTLICCEKQVEKVVYEEWQRIIKHTHEQSIYVSTIDLPIKRLAEIIRNHRWIENKLHYVLDMAFWEDGSRIRTKPENISLIKCIANNILRLNWETCIKNARFRNCVSFDRIKKYKHLF